MLKLNRKIVQEDRMAVTISPKIGEAKDPTVLPEEIAALQRANLE